MGSTMEWDNGSLQINQRTLAIAAENPRRVASQSKGRWRAVAAVVVVCAACCCVVASTVAAQERPYIYGCGVTWGHWLGMPQEQQRIFDGRSMDRIVEMGGTAIGGNFAWIDLEPTRGTYDFSYADHQVELATDRGLEIFAYSGLTPDWALPPEVPAQPGIGYRFPPDASYGEDFDRFFRTLSARYCGRVRNYQFWNEPNACSWIADSCHNFDGAPTYVPWLIRWYRAMKEGCADTVLSIGGLDCQLSIGTSCADYLASIYDNGGGDYFDAVAIHPYGDTNEATALNWPSVDRVRQILEEKGHGNRPIWINEYGWNTSDEDLKARLIERVLTDLERNERNTVTHALHLVLTDLPATPDDGHDWGLCDRDTTALTVTPRASYNAFRDHPKVFMPPPRPDGGQPIGLDGGIVTPGDGGVASGFDGGASRLPETGRVGGDGCACGLSTDRRSDPLPALGFVTALSLFAWRRRFRR